MIFLPCLVQHHVMLVHRLYKMLEKERTNTHNIFIQNTRSKGSRGQLAAWFAQLVMSSRALSDTGDLMPFVFITFHIFSFFTFPHHKPLAFASSGQIDMVGPPPPGGGKGWPEALDSSPTQQESDRVWTPFGNHTEHVVSCSNLFQFIGLKWNRIRR